jgi:hypothetical protein
MSKYTLRAAGFFLALTMTAGSFQTAHAEKSWKFEVANKSTQAVRSFRTQEDGAWSKNWIRGERIEPGDTFEMDFGTDEGDCTVRTRITFVDDSYFDEDIDYCNAEKIDLYDDTLKTR